MNGGSRFELESQGSTALGATSAATERNLTVREVNALTRHGGRGRNVYVEGRGLPGPMRVTRARTRAGRMEVRLLLGKGDRGEWVHVTPANKRRVFESL